MPPFDFTGTTSLVTGASSGLGAEFARQLADQGGNLVLVARSADRLDALADELRARHRVTVTTVPADLSLADEVSRVAAHAATIPVDVLVNNAGLGTYGIFDGRSRAGRPAGYGAWPDTCAAQSGLLPCSCRWPFIELEINLGYPASMLAGRISRPGRGGPEI